MTSIEILVDLSIGALAVGGFIYHYYKSRDFKKALRADIDTLNFVVGHILAAKTEAEKVADKVNAVKETAEEIETQLNPKDKK